MQLGTAHVGNNIPVHGLQRKVKFELGAFIALSLQLNRSSRNTRITTFAFCFVYFSIHVEELSSSRKT